jgi:hypothetical protein
MTQIRNTKKHISLLRWLLYLSAILGFVCVNVFGMLSTGYLPVRELAGLSILLIAAFVPPYFYQRLRNGTGALRSLEHGPNWQFAEQLDHRPKWERLTHWGIAQLRRVSLTVLPIGGITLGAGVLLQYLPAVFIGYFFAVLAIPGWLILGGLNALLLRIAIYPSSLWIGKFEFVKGWKAIFGGCSRVALGLFMFYPALSLLYLIYALAMGNLGDILRIR